MTPRSRLDPADSLSEGSRELLILRDEHADSASDRFAHVKKIPLPRDLLKKCWVDVLRRRAERRRDERDLRGAHSDAWEGLGLARRRPTLGVLEDIDLDIQRGSAHELKLIVQLIPQKCERFFAVRAATFRDVPHDIEVDGRANHGPFSQRREERRVAVIAPPSHKSVTSAAPPGPFAHPLEAQPGPEFSESVVAPAPNRNSGPIAVALADPFHKLSRHASSAPCGIDAKVRKTDSLPADIEQRVPDDNAVLRNGEE